MRCRDIQRRMIDRAEEDAGDSILVREHVSRCARCTAFRQALEQVRANLSQMENLEPSPGLVDKTRTMCHEQLLRRRSASKNAPDQPPFESVPKPIVAAIVGLIALTIFGVAFLLKDFSMGRKLSPPSILGMAVVVQNAVMLFLAPLLMRRCRASETLEF